MSKRPRRKHTDEFKREAVKLVVDRLRLYVNGELAAESGTFNATDYDISNVAYLLTQTLTGNSHSPPTQCEFHMAKKRAFSSDDIRTKKEDYHGSCNYVRTSPDVAAQGIKSVNLEMTFEEAMQLSLGIQSAVRSKNSADH